MARTDSPSSRIRLESRGSALASWGSAATQACSSSPSTRTRPLANARWRASSAALTAIHSSKVGMGRPRPSLWHGHWHARAPRVLSVAATTPGANDHPAHFGWPLAPPRAHAAVRRSRTRILWTLALSGNARRQTSQRHVFAFDSVPWRSDSSIGVRPVNRFAIRLTTVSSAIGSGFLSIWDRPKPKFCDDVVEAVGAPDIARGCDQIVRFDQ